MIAADRRTLVFGGLAAGLAASGTGAATRASARQSGREFQILFNVAQGAAVRHRPNLAVASYGVSYFYTGRTQALSRDGSAIIDTALYGVTPEMMADVAEAGCQDLRARLAAAGETVIGVDETRAALSAANVPMRPGNQNTGRGTFDGVTVAQRWLTVGSRMAPMVMGYSGEPNSMIAGLGTRNRLATASAQLDAIMLTPVIWLDYAQMRRSNAGAQGRVAIGVRGSPSGFIASAADVRGRLVMATLIPRNDAYSDLRYSADTTVGDSDSFMASLPDVNIRDARITADPVRWTEIATGALAGYNTGLAQAIRTIRGA